MKKDTLKNKRIDDAELEKVSGGVKPSDFVGVTLDRYNEYSKKWDGRFFQYSSASVYQGIFEIYWYEWRKAGFKPDAETFLYNNEYEIMVRLSHC